MEQLDLFGAMEGTYRITKPIRLIEFFAGIGAQSKALEVLGIPFESHKICEWAYNSIIAYNHIHRKDFTDYSEGKTKEELIAYLQGNISTDYNSPCDCTKKPLEWLKKAYNSCIATYNLMNIMKVKGKDLEITETDKYEYVLTYSFPCQDLSLAGKRKGMSVSQSEGGTRSGLLWEVERILNELSLSLSLPQILIMENVPEVVGAGNIKDFQRWELKLSQLGYVNHIKILNSKDYGIPQNRRRCFMVSILNGHFDFGGKIPLTHKLQDLLEDNVDEKFYLSEKMIKGMLATKFNSYKLENRVQDLGGCVDTLTTSTGNRCPHLIIKNATKEGFLLADEGDGIDISTRMEHHRGTVQKGMAQTLTTAGGKNVGVAVKDDEE